MPQPRHPPQVADLKVALPAGAGVPIVVPLRSAVDGRRGVRAHEVPQEDLAVVCSGREGAAARGRPLYAVDGAAVAAELQKRLAGLPHIEDANDIGVCRKGGEEVRVVGRGGQPEERGRIGHGLLRSGGAHPTAIGI